MKNSKKLSLATQIFIGLALGIIAGIIFMAAGATQVTIKYIKPFGTIFLNLIKFIVVPIVLSTIITGIISMKDIRKVGSVGIRTLVYYMCTTAFAVVIGLVFANIFKGTYSVMETSELEYNAADSVSFMDTFVEIFPSNAVEPLRAATMLQVIVIAIFFGFGIILSGEKGEPIGKVVESFAEVSFKAFSDWRILPHNSGCIGKRAENFGCFSARAINCIYSVHCPCSTHIFLNGKTFGRIVAVQIL